MKIFPFVDKDAAGDVRFLPSLTLDDAEKLSRSWRMGFSAETRDLLHKGTLLIKEALEDRRVPMRDR